MKYVLLDNMPGHFRVPKVKFSATPSHLGNVKKRGVGTFDPPPVLPIPLPSPTQNKLKQLMTLPETKTEADLSSAWSKVMKEKQHLMDLQDAKDKAAFSQHKKGHQSKAKHVTRKRKATEASPLSINKKSLKIRPSSSMHGQV